MSLSKAGTSGFYNLLALLVLLFIPTPRVCYNLFKVLQMEPSLCSGSFSSSPSTVTDTDLEKASFPQDWQNPECEESTKCSVTSLIFCPSLTYRILTIPATSENEEVMSSCFLLLLVLRGVSPEKIFQLKLSSSP